MSHYNPDDAIKLAPVAFAIVDTDHNIVYANEYARSLLSCDEEMNFRALLHPASVNAYEALHSGRAEQIQSAHIQLLGDANTRYLQLTSTKRPDGERYLWITDHSEARALRAQLQRAKQPGKRFLHELSNLLTAGIGYTELLQMLANEGKQLQGESLANVRRYLGELREALQRADTVLSNEKRGHTKLSSAKVTPVNRRHVLIVDDEPGVAAFLAELMRGRQHKATVFTDACAALDFFHTNSASIDLVIMDQMMPGVTGIGLATEMLSKMPTLPVILCTGDQQVIADQQSGKLNIKHFVSKPIDISELTELVIDLLEDG